MTGYDDGEGMSCGELNVRQYCCSGVSGDGPAGSFNCGNGVTDAAMISDKGALGGGRDVRKYQRAAAVVAGFLLRWAFRNLSEPENGNSSRHLGWRFLHPFFKCQNNTQK